MVGKVGDDCDDGDADEEGGGADESLAGAAAGCGPGSRGLRHLRHLASSL